MFGQTPRTNNDIVFLLDGSGSMLDENKWSAAVDATVLFYQLMKELRHESFKDRYASVVFKWDNIAGVDITKTVPAGTGLQGLDVLLTKAQLDAETPVRQNFTPIGEGLLKAIEQFDMNSEDSFYSNKTILLLSDGKQNRGVDPLYVPIPERIVVHAVGLGEDSIEPDTISDIAGATGGDFRISPSPREIEDFFVQILCNTSWKLQNVTVTGTTATIDQDIAVFVVVWDDPAMSIGFELDPPGGGANITPATLDAYPGMDVTYHAPAAGETHAFYTLKNISDDLLAEWQFINITDGAAPVAIDDVLLKVVEDPRTIADFAIEPGDYYIGQPIILTATITEDGNPKIGLTDVSSELIRSPAIHVGDAMADNTPPPDYPKEPASATDRTLRAHYLLGVMRTLGLSTLTSLDSSTIMLRDNGQGADRIANDGEYTGSFVNTEKEGSYTFKFRARGKNASGINFDRTETISEYVKFAVIPEESVIEMVASIEADDFVKTTLKVTPCGIGGVKMGPFYGDTIQLYSDVRQISTDYVDNRDGTYTLTISHPKNTKPKITVSVGDVLIAEQFQVQKKKDVFFSTEEDFVTQGPKPYDGNPIISDGDLLNAAGYVYMRNTKLLSELVEKEFDLGLDA
ncbi:VWA domain-containing protein, partial [bacterium]|nr:VWA domain-containing protein [bacterium]